MNRSALEDQASEASEGPRIPALAPPLQCSPRGYFSDLGWMLYCRTHRVVLRRTQNLVDQALARQLASQEVL